MNAKVRRRIDMGRRALEFSRAHLDASPGYSATLARLEELVTRCDALADQQLTGIHAVRAASARKRDLRRLMKGGHLRHLVRVARLAAAEVPELAQTFVLPERGASYLEFRTTARTIAAEATTHREVLVRFGLVESVLEDLTAAIARFELAVEQGIEARRAHVGASAELETVVVEVVAVVTALDGLNRLRFASDAEQLRAWRSASSIITVVRGTAPVEGEVKPAA